MQSSSSPEILATADLSPVSPSPLHSAAPVVPSLQDTADTLDAMSAEANGVAQGSVGETDIVDTTLVASSPNDSTADADSLNDAYGEEEESPVEKTQQGQEPDAGEDDYLKTFDSPAQGEEEDSGTHDVSKAPESIQSPVPSDLLTNLLSTFPQSSDNLPPAQPVVAAQSYDPTPAQPEPTPAEPTAPESTAPNGQDEPADEDASAADIARLMAEITAQASEPGTDQSHAPPPNPSLDPSQKPESYPPPALTSSLPPRPPLPQQAAHSFAPHDEYRSFQQTASNVPSAMIAPPTPGQPSTYVAAGAPGTYPDATSSLPPPPPTALNASSPITSLNAPPYPAAAGFSPQADDFTDRQRVWDAFVADERRYMSEAKWDRFPDGSRIFIGNLSSERVSKRDVFDIFHQYGRLAQISLKSAYGFVQYHTVEDAQAAMENLQGIEIKGRKIHLEYSRTQKKEKGDRARSPDRAGRGGRDSASKRGDRFEGDNRRSRDDYRPARNASPRRNNGHGRDDNYGRDRTYYESQGHSDTTGRTRRSRSPPQVRQADAYRRRSPSPANPYGRGVPEHDQLDIPRRYGAQVPDVQLLLLQELSREFVAWVERAFADRGLKTDVMFLHPNFPREAVIQRQVIEGVHAIVELDMRAHNFGKIPLRVFDRSTGMSARYDDYRDLDPHIAAELVLRAKSQAQPQAQPQPAYHAQPPQPSYPVGGYQQSYGVPPQVSPHTPTFPGHGGPPSHPTSSAAEIAGLMGQIDNATLQRLLATLNPPQAQSAAAPNPGVPQHLANQTPSAATSQLDIQALLGSMKGAAPPPAQPVSYGAQSYAPAPAASNGNSHPTGSSGDAAAVQSIMAQLARYRQ